MNKCIDCKKEIGKYSKRCQSCNNRYSSLKKCKNTNFRIKLAKNFGKYNKNKKNKHHLDLNEKNNSKDNLLYLINGKHQQFHRLAYHYLLKKFGIVEIRKYLKWFKKNYGV